MNLTPISEACADVRKWQAELPAIRQVLTHATNQKRTAPRDVGAYWDNIARVASIALNETVGEIDRDNARRQIPENVRLLKGYLARRAAPSALQTTLRKMEGLT